MSSSCLKLLVGLCLFVIITECRAKKLKRCHNQHDCDSGLSCIHNRCVNDTIDWHTTLDCTDIKDGMEHNMENCVPWLHTIDENDVAEIAQRMMQCQPKSMEERTTH